MEVISQQSSLERQLSSISGSELRLRLYFWRAAAAAAAAGGSPPHTFHRRVGLNERKCLAGCVPFSCVSLRVSVLCLARVRTHIKVGFFAAFPRTQMASLVSSPLRYPASGLLAIKRFQSRGNVRSKLFEDASSIFETKGGAANAACSRCNKDNMKGHRESLFNQSV